ncbi:transmembrane 7 superfamily member 3 isoform X1 [Neodiprion lecontei]|uniref:Transmembrane 7 superfamily member 3 isoform X1 n=1 Tax=Neodiprion lecontei TaxID=441921 RepID=A0A6J0BXE7_NEOLC|nr:transmembrane 7 superfamily member 3 isoform X1 [Neodiprion lecontei]
MSRGSAAALLLLFLIAATSSVTSNNADPSSAKPIDTKTVTISLENYDKFYKNEQAFTELIILAEKTVVQTIEVVQIPDVVSFLVVQIHTYQYNISLAYDKNFSPRRYTSGTNLGLVIDLIGGQNTASTYVKNENVVDVEAMVAVVAYTDAAPVPGGCNMEFETEIAPYQKLTISESSVKVAMQQAASPKFEGLRVPCERNGVLHEMYMMFLPEQDFSSVTYFDAVRAVLTVEGIRENGRKIPSSTSGSKMRRTYSAYPGTGSLYAAIAIIDNDTAAAYVPAFTYACSPLYWTDTCQVLTSSFSKVLCALTLFLGFFATFFGHKWFKTEMFLLGFLSGGIVSYIIVAIFGNYRLAGNIGIPVFVGCLLGFAWLGVWWLYAIPILPIMLATLTLGFIVASIAYFSSPAGDPYLENETSFWLIFTLIVLCVPLILSTVMKSATIVSCVILGSYAVVISIDHYAGSNLKYIVINVIRRATSPGFNLAVVHPPYQFKDICLTLFWATLAIAGFCVQLYQNRGKPPFPPGMSSLQGSRILVTERTPLLVESRIPVVTLRDDDDDDVFYSPDRKWYSGILKAVRGRKESPRHT